MGTDPVDSMDQQASSSSAPWSDALSLGEDAEIEQAFDSAEEGNLEGEDEIDMDDRYALPVLIQHDRAWVKNARCAREGISTDTFYVDRQRTLLVTALRLYCRECPVRWECLDFAISNHDRYGVWGGYVDKERRQIRKMVEAGIDLRSAAVAVRDLDSIPASAKREKIPIRRKNAARSAN